MNKDKVLNAANAIQNGADSGAYYDEIEIMIGLIMNASQDDIAEIWQEISTNAD